jgi:hypothetical protein
MELKIKSESVNSMKHLDNRIKIENRNGGN